MNIAQLTNLCNAEHARLKDHVGQMDGQLDARVQEGGKLSNLKSLR